MPVIEIHSLDDTMVQIYHRLTDHQLRNRLHPEEGVIIVESPKVILTALEAGLQPLSLLCESRHIRGDAAPIIARCPDITVFTGSRELLSSLTGYTLTRGVLCAMRRPQLSTWQELCAASHRLMVINAVCDTTNIGAIFRSAAALGFDGALLTTDSCDAFKSYRACFYGNGIQTAMGLARRTYGQPARFRFQDRGHGAPA